MTDNIRINPQVEKDRGPLLRFIRIYISIMGLVITAQVQSRL